MIDIDKLRASILCVENELGVIPYPAKTDFILLLERAARACDEVELLRSANDTLQDRVYELEPEE